MRMDVVYVTYNSQKWIEPCLTSLSEYAGEHEIYVTVVDNASMDGTVDALLCMKERIGNCFRGLEIVRLEKNIGFGGANNIGFSKGESDIVCFFNVDTRILRETLGNLEREIRSSGEETAVWELRQIPYEHPKLYNPVTLETEWASGAAFAVRRQAYEEIEGFEERFFMYAEDVDLSWRFRSKGYQIRYCPKAVICHDSYAIPGEIKFVQYAYGLRNNLLMRYRYGNWMDVLRGYVLVFKHMVKCREGADFLKRFWKVFFSHWKMIPYFLKNRVRCGWQPVFAGLNYAKSRCGAFYRVTILEDKPCVGIFVICEDQEEESGILENLRQQTYENYTVHVIQQPEMMQKWMEASGEKGWTRFCVVEASSRLYADHLETLVCGLRDEYDIVGTINGRGELSGEMACYLLSDSFYWKCSGDWEQMREMAPKVARRIEKQTVT